MLRQLNAYGPRIARDGLQALADLVALIDTAHRVLDVGVATCRAEPWSASWAQIGDAVGMTRQSAQERWGSLGGARRPGGQPARLR
jgi:hypothetical protein